MRITLVISNLLCGGAQRVASLFAGYWAEAGWQVTLLTLGQDGHQPFFDLHAAVEHCDLRSLQPIETAESGDQDAPLLKFAREVTPLERAFLFRERESLLRLRNAITTTNPDVVVSFVDITNVRVLIACLDLAIPIVVCEHTDPARVSLGSRVWTSLRRRVYPTAAAVVTLTQEALAHFSPAVRQIGWVIPNPVIAPESGAVRAERPGQRVLITLGRLSYEKGFDLLLRAFEKVARIHPSWTLEIWGEGPLRDQLALLIERLGLMGRASLRGLTARPYDVLRRADIFAMSSRIEGFPVALCEAMACGLPVVCCDCSPGVRAIVRDGVDGVLIPAEDVAGLAAALDGLMRDEQTRSRLGDRAQEVVDRFGIERVMVGWKKMFTHLESKGRVPQERGDSPALMLI
ncbi:MAG TPA: glycosyltransferase family 4 protein [Blastocatellia bacterium]|nr:glycosyltransferase family 4 protein [Blastocatellia bacterium]